MSILRVLRCNTLLLVSLLLLTINLQTSANENTLGYERRDSSLFANHACFLPWISDAVLNPTEKRLEVMLQSRCACEFNITEWHELVALFPQYKSQLADGLESNILQPICLHKTHSLHRILFKQTIHCIIPRLNTKKSYRVLSQVIEVLNPGFVDIAPLRVTCPLDNIDISTIDRLSTVKIHIPEKLFTLSNNSVSLNESANGRKESIEDEILPPILDTYHSFKKYTRQNTGMSAKTSFVALPEYARNSPQFEVAVCSVVTVTDKPEELLEWIEYHFALGIDHFYLYNPPLRRSQRNKTVSLSVLLSSYIQANLITVIPWSHSECVRGMGAGRSVQYANNTQEFRPPFGVNQMTGLASCYLRYTHTTRYMLSIDEDEFIVVNPSKHSKASTDSGSSRILQQWLREKQKQENFTLAFAFKPFFAYSCPQRSYQRPKKQHQHVQLRLDRNSYFGSAFHYEYKLLMNTSMVASYFVHYIYQLHSPYVQYFTFNGLEETIVNPTDAFLLHIRRFDQGSIFGQSLPLLPNSYFQSSVCDFTYYLPFLSQVQHDQKKQYLADKVTHNLAKEYYNNSMLEDEQEAFIAAISQKLMLDDTLLSHTRHAVKKRMAELSTRSDP